ncbi:MAG: hypothetical protein PHI84_01555 [Kiritimatiellae bacterium]|nr:hypothetical protein [Kiritimatiellia bacterium]
MSDLLFKCPSCSKNLYVDVTDIGSTLSCPTCNIKVTIPEPDFGFACPQCNAELCAPSSMSSVEFNCPSCKTTFVIPAVKKTPASKPKSFKCPSCGAVILDGMNICGNCLYDKKSGKKIGDLESPPVADKKKGNAIETLMLTWRDKGGISAMGMVDERCKGTEHISKIHIKGFSSPLYTGSNRLMMKATGTLVDTEDYSTVVSVSNDAPNMPDGEITLSASVAKDSGKVILIKFE